MLDASQVEVVAFVGDGDVYHNNGRCAPVPDAVQDVATKVTRQEWYRLVEELGDLEAIIRYTLHEWESSNWDDLEYAVDFDIAQPEGRYDDEHLDYQNELAQDTDGEWHDVSAYIGVYCDACGERIE